MNRIKTTFDELSSIGSKALITYIVAGDPNLETTLNIMNCMVEEGADIIEIGIPFSDPMAEGVSIQKGHERSLLNNTSIKDALNLVSKFSSKSGDSISTPTFNLSIKEPLLSPLTKRYFVV